MGARCRTTVSPLRTTLLSRTSAPTSLGPDAPTATTRMRMLGSWATAGKRMARLNARTATVSTCTSDGSRSRIQRSLSLARTLRSTNERTTPPDLPSDRLPPQGHHLDQHQSRVGHDLLVRLRPMRQALTSRAQGMKPHLRRALQFVADHKGTAHAAFPCGFRYNFEAPGIKRPPFRYTTIETLRSLGWLRLNAYSITSYRVELTSDGYRALQRTSPP
jgi:hypothetical protein